MIAMVKLVRIQIIKNGEQHANNEHDEIHAPENDDFIKITQKRQKQY